MLEMLSAARNRELNCQCLKPKDVYYLCDKNPRSRAGSALTGVIEHPGAFVFCSASSPRCRGPAVLGITGQCLQQMGREVGEKTFLLEPP